MSSRRLLLATFFVLPIIPLLDTAIAVGRGWDPPSRFHLLVAAASLATLAVLLALIALPAGRRLLFRRAPHLALLVLSLCIALFAAELLARSTSRLWSRFAHSRGAHVKKVFRPDPEIMHGVRGESLYTTNGVGVRGPDLPRAAGTYKILCLGGSSTECTYLDDAETWPYLLMQNLNSRTLNQPVWVGNLGISGYTTVEHLEFLQHSVWLEEIDSVILLIGVNDFLKALNGSMEMGPRPLWRRSAIVSSFYSIQRNYILRNLLNEQEDVRGSSLHRRRQVRRLAPTTRILPKLDRALEEYAERIAAIISTCRRRNFRCILFTHPVLWVEGLTDQERETLWLGQDRQGRFLDPGALREGIDSYNMVLRETGKRLNAEVVSLDSMHGDSRFFVDDCHFTEAGAEKFAGVVAQYLLPSLTTPPPEAASATDTASTYTR